MKRRGFGDGTVLIILLAVALAFLLYFWGSRPVASAPIAAPAKVVKPANAPPPADVPQTAPPTAKRQGD